MKRTMISLTAVIALAFVAACGGGDGSSGNASVLTYTDPVSVPAEAFCFRRNAALSNPASHVVLDLYGPVTGLSGSGLVLTLNVEAGKADWANVRSSDMAETYVARPSASPLDLGTGIQALKGHLSGSTLQVLISQKGVASPQALTGPLLQVALDLKSGVSVNTTIALSADLTASEVLLADGSLAAPEGVVFGNLVAQ